MFVRSISPKSFHSFYIIFDHHNPQERLTLAEKNERLQSQLRSLKEDLAHTRDDQVVMLSFQVVFHVSVLAYMLTLSLQGGDDDGQDPQGECEAGQGQVQDPEGGEEGQHKEEGGSVREHVS